MMHKYPESILLPEPISKFMNWITTFILSNGPSLEMSGTTWIISFQEFGLEQSGRIQMCSGDDAGSNPSFSITSRHIHEGLCYINQFNPMHESHCLFPQHNRSLRDP